MTRDSSVWEYFREPYEHKLVGSKTRTFYRDGIRRTDGFTIVRLVSYDNGQYCCRGSFGEFRFVARRSKAQGSTPSDLYVVYVDEFDSKWPGDKKKNRELCLAHLKDIESALLHFPTVFYFDCIPEESYLNLKEEGSKLPEVSQVSKKI